MNPSSVTPWRHHKDLRVTVAGSEDWARIKEETSLFWLRCRQYGAVFMKQLKGILLNLLRFSKDIILEAPKLRGLPRMMFVVMILSIISAIWVGVCDIYPFVSMIVVGAFTDIYKFIMVPVADLIDIFIKDVYDKFFAFLCSALNIHILSFHEDFGQPLCNLDSAQGIQLDGVLSIFPFLVAFMQGCGDKYHIFGIRYAFLFIQPYTTNAVRPLRDDLDGQQLWMILLHYVIIGLLCLSICWWLYIRKSKGIFARKMVHCAMSFFLTAAFDPTNLYSRKACNEHFEHLTKKHRTMPIPRDPWLWQKVVLITLTLVLMMGGAVWMHLGGVFDASTNWLLDPFIADGTINDNCVKLCLGYLLLWLCSVALLLDIIFIFHRAIKDLILFFAYVAWLFSFWAVFGISHFVRPVLKDLFKACCWRCRRRDRVWKSGKKKRA